MVFLMFSLLAQEPENTPSVFNNIELNEVELENKKTEESDQKFLKSKKDLSAPVRSPRQTNSKYKNTYSSQYSQSKQALETETKRVKYQTNSRSPSIQSQQRMDHELGLLKELDDQLIEIEERMQTIRF